MYIEVKGDLIKLAKEGHFDVIAHGCNCFCNMGAGIAVPMNKAFGCGEYKLEDPSTIGDINKLGQIDVKIHHIPGKNSPEGNKLLSVVNAYTQYKTGVQLKPLDYDALTLCMRKINYIYKGMHVGLPMIGAGLAGGNWDQIKKIIQKELKDCHVTIVIFEKN